MNITKNTVYSFLTLLRQGPVLRLAPQVIDAQFPEVAYQAWGGQNESKQPWDQDATMSSAGRLGFKVDNLFSTTKAREGMRLRRLVGPPFAKKFLQEQEEIFKDCAKRMIEKVKVMIGSGHNKVDLLLEYKNYAMDVVSISSCLTRIMLAEFSFGGYFKEGSIRPGVTSIQLIEEVPLASVLSSRCSLITRFLQHSTPFYSIFSHCCLSRDVCGQNPEQNT